MKASDLPLHYNAVDLLDRNLATRPHKIALASRARSLTFAEVANEAGQVANALLRLGIRRGDCVGILAPDSAEWVTSFFGIIRIGAVVVCLNTQLQPAEYDYIVRDSRLRALIVHDSLRESFRPLITPLPDRQDELAHIVVIGQPGGAADIAFSEWIASEPGEAATAPTHRDDFCSLHYSSGTTGQPKGMFHAHKDYALIAHNTGVELFGLTEQDVTFSVAKLFFVYGLGANLIMPWAVGARITLHPGAPRLGADLLEMIDQFRPTVLFSVPTAYLTKLSFLQNSGRYDLSTLRLCISAGEALPEAVWRSWFEKTGLSILDSIGATETLHTFLSNRPDDLRPGSSGKPSPGYEVRIVDESGRDLPPGEVGNLLVRGESTSLFYLHQYEKSRQTFQGEWFATGDKYHVDGDGFYWHAGRSDDMLKVGGLWVAPAEVEMVLNSHPAVAECAVVGVADSQALIKPKAFVRLNGGYAPDVAIIRQLLQHCGNTLPAYKCPRLIQFVEELPRTATGKIQRFKLRD